MKSTHIQIRVSPDEKRLFKEAADLAGLSLSGWMMAWLLWAAKRATGERKEPKTVIRKKTTKKVSQ